MSEANRERRSQEKAEHERKEAEDQIASVRKEVKTREWQGLWNERAVTGKFTGLMGSKRKDDLKDIAQTLCLDVNGKNQELTNRINHHLNVTPGLKNNE